MICDDLSRVAVYVRPYIDASFSSSYFRSGKKGEGVSLFFLLSSSRSLGDPRLLVAFSPFVSRNDAIVVHYLFDSSPSPVTMIQLRRASLFGEK